VADSGKLSRWWILAGVIAVVACVVEIVTWRRLHPIQPKLISSRQLTSNQVPKDHLTLSPDGKQLYFDEVVSAKHRIVRISSDGGEVIPVETNLVDPGILDVSAQAELLVSSAEEKTGPSDLWIIDSRSGAAKRADNIVASQGLWRNDGRLVFVRGRDFYLAEHDGANPQKWITAEGPPFAPHFSPNGTRLRFTIGDPKSRSTMWESGMDGSGMHAILPLPDWNAPPAPCCGRWTSQGKYFVFSNAGRIWIIAETPGRHSEPVELTSGPLGFSDPVPGPDGKKLFAIGVNPRAQLSQYNVSTGGFSPFLGGISAGDVDFSSDGQLVAYISYPDGTLWRSKVDGSEKLRLTSPPLQVATPRWSRDSKRIAFSGGMPGEPWKVWTVSKDAENLGRLTEDNVANADPAWSPEGHRLAFVRFSQPSKIELFDLDVSSRTELEGSSGFWHIRWSPDGCCIAALQADSAALMVYERSKKIWRVLASNLGRMEAPSWSHDSKYLYLTVTFPTGPAYIRVGVSDGKIKRLAGLNDVRRYLGLWGYWSGLGPGDVPLFALDNGEQEIYAFEWRLP
jgi:Tol biopolymer transport system component